MLSSIMLILVGLVTLFVGRRIFWVFVGVAGFIFGLGVAQVGLSIQSQTLQILAGVCVGLIFAGLALAVQRPMAMVAGFIALGSVGLGLGTQLGAAPVMQIALFLALGLIGVLLVAALFDWALIIVSALNGAAAVGGGLGELYPLSPLIATAVVIILIILGVAYQSRDLGTKVAGIDS
ncbi:hypothetical protein K2Z83_15820 [Oscillochloris sp. ZM17-4]|uniref:hypothetical protein n=1 Tax=Oscillochloris sp. ZM17-4 TaxID=2866714 RepID=UPI001C72E0FB|nr:hypothetical protein [Oscillochloris sp. ZM17-4]MBX0329140.1 hypothetical protein [Oscillochloris sp. ZM17-4]